MKYINLSAIAATVMLSAALAGCGGGSGDSSPSSTATPNTDQPTFEAFTLAPNAAYNVDWQLPLSGTPTNGPDFLVESHASVAASPSTGTQHLTGSAPTSIANTLSVPPVFAVPRFLVNGAIVLGSASESLSYEGTSIRVDELSPDGATVVDSQMRSNLSIVPLSGAVSAAPTDVAHWFNSIYFNPALLNPSATWTTGSAYLKYTATEVNDRYAVVDYTGPTTLTNAPTPVASGSTIATLMAAGGVAADGTTYTMSNGTVSSINGLITYVASTAIPNSTTQAYRVLFELNGNVYIGDLVKAGTVIGGTTYPVATSSTSFVTNYSNQYQLRLNAAAVSSLHSAVTF